jgi:hypothetical protein
MLDQFIDAIWLYPLIVVVLVGAAELAAWIGRRRRLSERPEEMAILTASALGLLALLLAFSLSHALSRFESRRALVLDEANAIESAANFASMLPKEAQPEIRSELHDYTEVRIGLRRPYDPAKLESDAARSREILNQLWRQAVTVSDPQSLSVNRFVMALDDVTKIQEQRLVSAQYYVPGAVLLLLLGVAVVAIGFTGYQSGLTESRLHAPTMLTAVTIAVVIVLVVDLDQPARGFIRVPVQALIDVAKTLER